MFDNASHKLIKSIRRDIREVSILSGLIPARVLAQSFDSGSALNDTKKSKWQNSWESKSLHLKLMNAPTLIARE